MHRNEVGSAMDCASDSVLPLIRRSNVAELWKILHKSVRFPLQSELVQQASVQTSPLRPLGLPFAVVSSLSLLPSHFTFLVLL